MCFNIVISKLVEKVQSELQWLEPEEKTIRFIGLKLTEAYLEKVYSSQDDLSYSYHDKSLYSFKRCYMDTLNAIYNKTVFINKLRQLLTTTIEERKFDIDISVNNIRLDICKLSTLENDIKALSGETISQDFGNLINEAVSAANNLKMNKLEEGLKEFLNNHKTIVKGLEYDFIMEDIWEEAYDKILIGKKDFKNDPILRYLGLDYGHDDNKKEFAKQISGIFNANHAEIFDSMENYIAAYREVTADMFMCKILELNIFGYLDCVMRDIPIDRVISNEFLTRFIYVIYFVYIHKAQGDNIHNFDDCEEFKFLKAGIDSSVEILNLMCDLKNGEWKFDFDGDTPEELAYKCISVAKMLYNKDDDNKSNKEDDDTGNNDYFAKEYMHYDKMYLLFSRLKISWKHELVKLKKDENIVNDLEKGNEVLENIRIDFFNKKIDTDSFDENLERYCNSFRDYWNESVIRCGKSTEKMAELNNTVINFVQYMYYKNKLKNAKQCYEWGRKL